MDLYTPGGSFCDYWNEYVGKCMSAFPHPTRVFSADALEDALREYPIRKPHERYPKLDLDQYGREKIARLNSIADLIHNNPRSETVFKTAVNEVLRLLYGKRKKLWYPEPAFDPDLLNNYLSQI